MCRIIDYYVENPHPLQRIWQITTIFATVLHVSTKSVLYTGYIPVSCRKMSADVKSWSLMSRIVYPHLFFLYSIYHFIKKVNKNFSPNYDKIRHNYYSILHLKCQELFFASFPIIQHDFIRHISATFFGKHLSTLISNIFLSHFSTQGLIEIYCWFLSIVKNLISKKQRRF